MAPHRIGTGTGTRTTHQHRHRPCDSAAHCTATAPAPVPPTSTGPSKRVYGTALHQHRTRTSATHQSSPPAPVPPVAIWARLLRVVNNPPRRPRSSPPPTPSPVEEGLGSVRSTSGLSVPSIGSVRPMSPQAGIGSTGSKAVSISLPDALERCIQRRFSRWFRIWRRAVPSLGALPLPLPPLCGRAR